MHQPKRIEKTPPGMKCCGKCQKEFPKNTDWFDKDQAKEDGFKNWCKPCRKERRDMARLKNAAKLLDQLDMAVVANLAESKPGGSAVPHAAELYQSIMGLLGNTQGFAMHYVGNMIAAKPGSQTRERMLNGVLKLGQAVSDTNKVSMPAELMSDEDLESELKKREDRMRVIPATFTDVESPDQPDAGSRESA